MNRLSPSFNKVLDIKRQRKSYSEEDLNAIHFKGDDLVRRKYWIYSDGTGELTEAYFEDQWFNLIHLMSMFDIYLVIKSSYLIKISLGIP